ncbi:hypothetical protein JW960_06005 [candidate division KSB1 bacterium]|nr:hypothetical protein [candidate division KSB1 bacterium]
MKEIFLILSLIFLIYHQGHSQQIKSIIVTKDSIIVIQRTESSDTANIKNLLTNKPLIISDIYSPIHNPGIPVTLSFDTNSNNQLKFQDQLNLNLKKIPKITHEYNPMTNQYNYMYHPETLNLFSRDPNKKPDPRDYLLPQRDELEVLQILWDKGDSPDYLIYGELDRSQNMTMTDLNQLLETMDEKHLISREKISPEQLFGFAAFGNEIGGFEMSSKNKKNQVFLCHNLIDELQMKNLISASAYLSENDPTQLDPKQLRIISSDSTFLPDLLGKILLGRKSDVE